MSRDQQPIIPEKVRFLFAARRCAGSISDAGYSSTYVSDVDISSLTPSDSDVQVVDGRPNVTHVVRDLGPALLNMPSADPTNRTALDDLAGKYSQDWFDWATSDKPGDVVYSGIVAPKACGLVDVVAFSYTMEAVTTRVQSPAFNGIPSILCHADPAVTGCTDANNSGNPVDKTPGIEVITGPITCGSGGGMAHITGVDTDGGITGIAVDFAGTYTGIPVVCFEDNGASSGASATANISGGGISSVTVDSAGSGYTVDSIVSFYGGGIKYQYAKKRVLLEGGRLVTRFVCYANIG